MREKPLYDPVPYWNARPDPNRKGQVALAPGTRIWDYLKRHIEPDMKLFELGPGKGRLFPVFSGHAVSTLDISTNYQRQIASAASANNIALDTHFSSDPGARFPFDDDAFDIAIACQVMIHIPFDYIRHTLSELGRISRKAIVISGHDIGWPTGPGEVATTDHCFNHEYFTEITNLGYHVEDVLIFDRAKHFTFFRPSV